MAYNNKGHHYIILGAILEKLGRINDAIESYD